MTEASARWVVPSPTASTSAWSWVRMFWSSVRGRPRPPRRPPFEELRRFCVRRSGSWFKHHWESRIGCAPQRPPSVLIPAHWRIGRYPPLISGKKLWRRDGLGHRPEPTAVRRTYDAPHHREGVGSTEGTSPCRAPTVGFSIMRPCARPAGGG